MSTFASFLVAQSGAALDTLAGFDREAALEAGIRPGNVNDWALVHDTYFGSTKRTAQQRHAVDLARAGSVSIDQLVLIEKKVRAVKDPREQWSMRFSLLGVGGGYEAVRQKAKALIEADPRPPRKQVRFSKSRQGMRTMSVTGEERDIADLEHALLRGVDPARPVAPQMLDNFVRLMRRDGAGVPAAVPRPMVLVPLPAWTRILRGEGDDIILGLTDATTMTGAEFLQQCAGADLEIAAVHPQEGPVNLYRGERLANKKQRDLARVAAPVCPVPGCRHGADCCEIHHITAWRHGGETNWNNLAPLCRYHNRVNDDDPRRVKRGRIERINGTPVWNSPRGYAVPNKYHRFGAVHSLFGIDRTDAPENAPP
ncbi:HNH endonuclease signature motif containing protein [Corynebacterium sp. P3-F1]|uniref:HNH endonuclease signature motif containing protein n=1 Tax=Corynebacterium sp. P3-F1 TaxID=3059080 RepID=UPI00265CF01A|nr:HNH endonuclease signature motif containing protein [Corynebacterium sp. P3-F1]WKK61696.1 HNH endonuclease signature motif containing protein [Corynebacterium sp. P3-F1]